MGDIIISHGPPGSGAGGKRAPATFDTAMLMQLARALAAFRLSADIGAPGLDARLAADAIDIALIEQQSELDGYDNTTRDEVFSALLAALDAGGLVPAGFYTLLNAQFFTPGLANIRADDQDAAARPDVAALIRSRIP